ncbi:Regulation of nuclear pre-mRNA domain-containing protein 1A [Physocladia obscura]|uniref:Regulation of nuclear pre-mRNA domain-containing protein 1A n=1 Tax=Physocladia obscura TaxID=109957 RepID=A0AAD5T415_9FUNG|nr:Regulation of nuclear pre-mRNA domain-containing protein 1A [Physocladia obscura]
MTFSEEMFQSKLTKLVDTQDSINLVSHWLIYHRKNAKESVTVWAKEFAKVSTNKKLTFLHLANDVLQVSRKKADDFSKEYAKILPTALRQFSTHANDDLKAKVRRLLTIWDERAVYTKDFVAELKALIVVGATESSSSSSSKHSRPNSGTSTKPPSAPPQSPTSISGSHHHTDTVKSILHHTDSIKHLHTNRVYLERTISTAEPSLDPATVASQLNSLTMALGSELNARKRLVDDLKRWINVEESAISKISDAIQDLSVTSQQQLFLKAELPSPISSANAAMANTLSPNSSYHEQQQHESRAEFTIKTRWDSNQEQKDFESSTPTASPKQIPRLSSSKNMFSDQMQIDNDHQLLPFSLPLPPPPPPPPLVEGTAAPAAQFSGGITIPAELLFAAQSAMQNNEPGSAEVFNLLSGITGSSGDSFFGDISTSKDTAVATAAATVGGSSSRDNGDFGGINNVNVSGENGV